MTAPQAVSQQNPSKVAFGKVLAIQIVAYVVLVALALVPGIAYGDSANPAVGPELAKGIVEFRENVGDIKSMDELLEVKGVTPEVLEKLKQAVTVEAIEGAECSC